jgi:hypothetical protein
MQPVSSFYPQTEAWQTKESLDWLSLLAAGNLQAQELELAHCKSDPWRFLTHWVQTEDAQNKEQPFQPFPNKLHLQVLTHYWYQERFLLVPKSRQMTCTWLFAGLYLWDSLFWPSRMTIFQCKIEQDADANLKRLNTMHERLPKWMRDWQPLKYTYCSALFPRSRSEILAVPAGAKHYRQRTLTGAWVDEAAFTEDMGEVMAAAKPALGKSGRFTAISSASPSYFKQLCFDEV